MSSYELKEDMFLSENFNEKQWLSNILGTHSSDSEQLRLLTVIDSKLQMVHHNCITSLAFTQKMLATKLEESSSYINQAEKSLENIANSHKPHTETKEELEMKEIGKTLEEIWTTKSRIENTLDSLTSIETFEVKAMELDNVLQKGSLEEILEHIENMRNTFSVIKSISGHLPGQKRSFDNLKAKLLNFSNPILEQAVNDGDITKIIKLSKIYDSIDSNMVLIEKYAKLEENLFLKMFADKLVLAQKPDPMNPKNISENTAEGWIQVFLDSLSEFIEKRKSNIAEVLPSESQVSFYKILLQMIISKTEDNFIEKFFSEDIQEHSRIYNKCLEKFNEIINNCSKNIEQNQTELIPVLFKPCKNIIVMLLDRYLSSVSIDLKKLFAYLKYDDFELKELRKNINILTTRLKTVYFEYKNICLHYQIATFISGLKKNIEEFLQVFIEELSKKGADLHGGLSIALIDGQTDKEPHKDFTVFDWKRLQIGIIQFDIIQDLLNGLENIQIQINSDIAKLSKSQEYQLISYSTYAQYLENQCGIALYKKVQASTPTLQISEEIKSNISTVSKNIVIKIFYSPIYKQVMYLQTSKIWNAIDDSDPDLPQFSLTPSENITAIGEEIISVIHKLESLNSFIMTSPDKIERYQNLYRKEQKAKPKENEGTIDVGIYWLAVLGASVCQILGAKCMQIHSISDKGSRQLSADISYILNILKIISIEPTVRAILDSLHIGLKLDPKNIGPDMQEKINKLIETNEQLKGVQKELVDIGIVKGILAKRGQNIKK